MNIGWPEGIWIGLMLLVLCIAANEHGKPKTGEHNFAVSFMSALLTLGLLYWGGFFA